MHQRWVFKEGTHISVAGIDLIWIYIGCSVKTEVCDVLHHSRDQGRWLSPCLWRANLHDLKASRSTKANSRRQIIGNFLITSLDSSLGQPESISNWKCHEESAYPVIASVIVCDIYLGALPCNHIWPSHQVDPTSAQFTLQYKMHIERLKLMEFIWMHPSCCSCWQSLWQRCRVSSTKSQAHSWCSFQFKYLHSLRPVYYSILQRLSVLVHGYLRFWL